MPGCRISRTDKRRRVALGGEYWGAGAQMTGGNDQGQRRGRIWLLRLCFVFSLGLAACQPIYSNHGYIPTEDALALLQVGTDTRESVSATIGRPSASGLLNDEAWYYVQSKWKTIGPAEPIEVTREMVAISFDANGKVANIERFGLDQGRIVPLSRRVTTTNIRPKGILAQIMGNIGKLSTDGLFK